MQYTMEEKFALIREAVLKSDSRDPVKIARSVMGEDFVALHGPEHHFLDGGALLTAYRNAGGELDLESALETLKERTLKMPGAMCGQWGVCGAAAAMGAALAVLHGTGPLTANEYYADNLALTSRILMKMAELGGPRCCKRNAFLSLSTAAEFVRERYGLPLETGEIVCSYSPRNAQCLGNKCPFFAEK